MAQQKLIESLASLRAKGATVAALLRSHVASPWLVDFGRWCKSTVAAAAILALDGTVTALGPLSGVCLIAACAAAGPHSMVLLSERFIPLYGGISVPGVITWPYFGAWVLGKATIAGNKLVAIELIASAALSMVANFAHWARQTPANTAVRQAICIWLTGLGLHFFDIYRIAALPSAWDGKLLVDGLTFGEALRCAEAVSVVWIASLWMPLRFNRVCPHIIGPFLFALKSMSVSIVFWVTVMVIVTPWMLPYAARLIQEFQNDPTISGKIAHVLVGIVILFPLWKPITALLAQFNHFLGLIRQLLLIQPPLPRQPLVPPARRR